MKKRFFLIGLLLLCLVAFCAQAEDIPVEDAPVILQNGDEIILSLKFSGEMAGLQAEIQWDPLCMALDTVPEFNPEFKSGSMVAMMNHDDLFGVLSMVYLREECMQAADMEVVEITLRVLDDALPCETVVQIVNCQLADAKAEPLDCLCESYQFQIGDVLPETSVEPSVTPETEPTLDPDPQPTDDPDIAKLYFTRVEPLEPTDEPTAKPDTDPTPKPDDPTKKPTTSPTKKPTPAPTKKPTSSPTKKPSSGGDSSGGSDTGSDPTRKPTPEPTIPSVDLDDPTPAPDLDGGKLYMRTRDIDGGFAIDLIAENMVIGGLQAGIYYNSDAAMATDAYFSDAFAADAVVNIINDATPGEVIMVYSNVSGYVADGSVIFTADFFAEDTTDVLLADVMLSDAEGNDLSDTVSAQYITWEIQPMDDMEIVDEDSVRTMIVSGGSASLTMDPGKFVALQMEDAKAEDVIWTSTREDVAVVSEDGIVEALRSGLVSLTAVEIDTGDCLAEVRVCVRNAQMGMPVEIIEISYDDGMGEAFALTASFDEVEYDMRGVTLYFEDEDRTVKVRGLLPADASSVPSNAFDLCGNLVRIEIDCENIFIIEDDAFSHCPMLENVVLGENAIVIGETAFPDHARFVLTAPENSAAHDYAAENGLAFEDARAEVEG